MIALAAVGMFDGALGVAWPSMRETFDQPLAALGVVVLAYTGGYFVTSAIGGWLLERVGTGRAMIGIGASAIAGASLFAISPAWAVVLAGALLLGVSGGAADLTLNHELAQHHGVRALGFLHATWGLGAAAGPVLVTAFVTGDRSWRLAFVPIIGVQVVLLAAYLVVRNDWAPVPRRADVPDDVEPLDKTALGLALAMFFVYVGVELGAGQWGYTLLTDGRQLAEGTAGAWMSSYWLALTAGRLLLGLGGHRHDPDRLLTVSVVVAVASAVFIWVDPLGAGVAGLVPLGLALAAVFPVLVAVTPARLGEHRAARAIGMQIAASSVGGVVLSSTYGIGAQAWGPDALAPMFVVSSTVLAVLHGAAQRRPRATR